MKNNFLKPFLRFGFVILTILCFQIITIAQDTKITINGNDVGSWFARNWIWVTMGIIFLLVFLLISGNSRRIRHQTTIFRNNKGEITKTEITKTEED